MKFVFLWNRIYIKYWEFFWFVELWFDRGLLFIVGWGVFFKDYLIVGGSIVVLLLVDWGGGL